MKEIVINDDVIKYFFMLWKRNENKQFVKDRVAKCVTSEKRPLLTTQLFWSELVKTINTTQTKSVGKNNPMDRWIKNDNYKVKDWNWVSDKTDENLIKQAVEEFENSKIRYANGKSKYVPKNRNFILKNEIKLLKEIERIEIGNKYSEREGVDFLKENLVGLGLKQSRNLLQDLGRSQYQVPIDSRVIKQLEKSGIEIGKINLSSEAHYLKLQETIWAISEKIGVLPCVFDAFAFIDD